MLWADVLGQLGRTLSWAARIFFRAFIVLQLSQKFSDCKFHHRDEIQVFWTFLAAGCTGFVVDSYALIFLLFFARK